MLEFLQMFCFAIFIILTIITFLSCHEMYQGGVLVPFIMLIILFFCGSPILYSFKEYKVVNSKVVPFCLIQKEHKLLVLVDEELIYNIDSYTTASKLLNNSCTAYFQTWERKYGFNWKQEKVRLFDSAGNLVFDISK